MAIKFMPAANGSARTPLGPIRLCLQPRAAHALRSDQDQLNFGVDYEEK